MAIQPSTKTASSRIGLCALFAAALMGSAALPSNAEAFDFKLPASDYGEVVLPLRQSLGDAARDVIDRKNVFEPVGLLREDDPVRQLARSVGRLDLKVEEDGQQFLSTCTATIVEGGLVLTNYHCIPGFSGNVLEASLLLDYYGPDSQTTRIPVETTPVEQDPTLDYALARLAGPVPEGLQPPSFTPDRPRPLERLLVIHHPAGQPKMMTQFRCYAAQSQDEGPKLRHRCDTLPGSSGAPIFNTERQVIGIHHSGGLNENDPNSFNQGSNSSDILLKSAFLHAPAAGAPQDDATPVATAPSNGTTQPAAAEQPSVGRSNAGDPAQNSFINGGVDPAAEYNKLLSQ